MLHQTVVWGRSARGFLYLPARWRWPHNTTRTGSVLCLCDKGLICIVRCRSRAQFRGLVAIGVVRTACALRFVAHDPPDLASIMHVRNAAESGQNRTDAGNEPARWILYSVAPLTPSAAFWR